MSGPTVSNLPNVPTRFAQKLEWKFEVMWRYDYGGFDASIWQPWSIKKPEGIRNGHGQGDTSQDTERWVSRQQDVPSREDLSPSPSLFMRGVSFIFESGVRSNYADFHQNRHGNAMQQFEHHMVANIHSIGSLTCIFELVTSILLDPKPQFHPKHICKTCNGNILQEHPVLHPAHVRKVHLNQNLNLILVAHLH